jgi:hypothetical protein
MSDSSKSNRPSLPKLRLMQLEKLTTILVVDSIEVCLPALLALGHEVTVRVPEDGELDFVILSSKAGELALQTKRSLADDLPLVAKRSPSVLLYADVASLAEAKAALPTAEVLVSERKTFYGATESWLVLPGGTILGLDQRG